ncbi:MAG TPA: signal peptidase I [Nitrososphaeraceae archaeon]|nr:signal peptidase I [Nitrososphaeraceae archaeon]
MLNKDESKVHGAVKDIVIVVIGVAIVWLGLRFVFGTNNPFYIVSSGSMVPTLNINDVLIVKDGTGGNSNTNSFNSLKVGDIIVFHRPTGPDRVIVHRVAEIYNNFEGERIVRTKGDANPSSIPGVDYPIRAQQYIGKVAYVIPGIGLITKIISPPVNYVIIIVILAVLFFNRIGRRKDAKTSQSSSTGNANTFSPPSSPPPN